MEKILELSKVSKTFPKSSFTLDEVSFSLPYGTIMGVVGENGAGKTTTIGCILNTLTKDSGEIKIFGKEMHDFLELAEKLGYSEYEIQKIMDARLFLDKQEQEQVAEALDVSLDILYEPQEDQLYESVGCMECRGKFSTADNKKII